MILDHIRNIKKKHLKIIEFYIYFFQLSRINKKYNK
jgi:hypothetical protein